MTAVIHSDAQLPPGRVRRSPEHWVSWKVREENALRRLYPSASKADICEEFPGRTWASIRRHAALLGIERLESMPRNENIHPVVDALINCRIMLGLRPAQAARLIGWSPKWLSALERGARLPTLAMLDQWAAALGMELMLAPIEPCATESATNQE